MRENTLIGKRKRAVANDEIHDDSRSKGADDDHPGLRLDSFQELLVDILEVLRRYAFCSLASMGAGKSRC